MKRTTSWGPFWVVFPLLALVPVIALVGHGVWWVSTRMEEVGRAERFAVGLAREAVARSLDHVAADVCMLAGQNELAAYLTDGSPDARAGMAREYAILSRTVQVYDQIRYIDATGREIVRVNNEDGVPIAVAAADLQNKVGRYYVPEAMALEPGMIYVSPLDLNIERGEIEVPHKPVIRVATPVADAQGRKRGLVLINVRAQDMLDRVADAGAVSVGRPMMMNNEGYWFVSPFPSPSWGFMFPDRADDRMPDLFPTAWDHMTRYPRGDVRTPHGLFTYESYSPLDAIEDCPRPSIAGDPLGYRWVLASHVPESYLVEVRRAATVNALVVGVPVLVLLAVGTRAVMVVVAERRRHRVNLEALARFDALTSLANRATFDEHLAQEVRRSQRYGRRFAVLYMDLDGFKPINDTLGHEAGDRVLIDVARVLTESCRAVDTPARYGGDEFVVLLKEIAGVEAARGVAEKILARVRALSWEGHTVGVSIGVALWPDDAEEGAAVVRLADEAMYAAKAAGKTCVRLARDL